MVLRYMQVLTDITMPFLREDSKSLGLVRRAFLVTFNLAGDTVSPVCTTAKPVAGMLPLAGE